MDFIAHLSHAKDKQNYPSCALLGTRADTEDVDLNPTKHKGGFSFSMEKGLKRLNNLGRTLETKTFCWLNRNISRNRKRRWKLKVGILRGAKAIINI